MVLTTASRACPVGETGTLTEGKPRLVTVAPNEPFDEPELLRLAASREHVSEHPLASTIVAGAKERVVPLVAVDGFESIRARV